MAEGRSRQWWDHTSETLAMLANGLCRGKDDPAFRASQFHPYRIDEVAARGVSAEESRESFEVLRGLFATKK